MVAQTQQGNMQALNERESRNALVDAETRLGSNDRGLVPFIDQLAYSCHSAGNYDEAEECYSRAISITEKNEGEDSPHLVPRLHNLAVLYRIQEKFKEAEQVYKRTISITQNFEPDKILDLATQKNYLAGLYFAWGRLPDAENLVNDSLKIYTDVLGRDHEYASFCLMGLALIHKHAGKDAQAEQFFSECERQMKAAPRLEYLESFQDIAHSLFFLSRQHYRQGRLEDAQILFRYALLSETWELWPYHPFVSQSLHLLADLYAAQGMYGEAEHIYKKALVLRQSVLGDQHASVATTAHSLAKLLHREKRFEEAGNLYKLALSIRRHASYPPLLAQTLTAYADLLKETREGDKGKDLEDEAKRILDAYKPAVQDRT
jgi:tetratricopeptide (TPR) repeat protein